MTLQIFVLWYLHSLKNKYKILIRHLDFRGIVDSGFEITDGHVRSTVRCWRVL
jgi:hypothetical protein